MPRVLPLVTAVLTVALACATAPAAASPPRSPGVTGTPVAGTTPYTVRPNDSWFGIAARHGVSPFTLARANGATFDTPLHPGHTVQIPRASRAAARQMAAPRAVATSAPAPVRAPADVRSSAAKQAYVPLFRAAAREFRVPADLLMAQAYRESRWERRVVSHARAIGIGQLLPETARWTAQVLMKEPGLSPWVPEDNIRMQARFLRFLLDRYQGNEYRALAAYYQGPFAVERSGVSPVGGAYARSVQALRAQFR
jgi:N-acetylmuramoyl-L-alanine amidase